jgi:nucleoside phosphorylase
VRPAVAVRVAGIALAAVVAAAAGCGDAAPPASRVYGVVTAMPSEAGAVLEHATIDEVREVDGRWFRLGRIGPTRVVVAMTGVGIENARSTARALLSSFDLSGVVVAGVAAGTRGVGDVAVPASWEAGHGARAACEPAWIERARAQASAGRVALERCTAIPGTAPLPGLRPGDRVCLETTPAVVVGGVGRSGDDAAGATAACEPGGDDVFACDEAAPPPAPPAGGPAEPAPLLEAAPGIVVARDMETAAVAVEAAASGLPFIAFRASSDGPGDPLALEGFLQFFAWYRLASRNAASATASFLAGL